MQRDLSYWLKIAPFELSEADQLSLTLTDDAYVAQTWEDLKAAIGKQDCNNRSSGARAQQF
jgi:hypothetical protein